MSTIVLHLLFLALTGPVLWLIRPHRLRFGGWLAALPPTIVTIWQLTQLSVVSQGQYPTAEVDWAPALGLTLSLRVDGLALFFGLIITGIGAAIALYTHYYLEDDPRQGYFYNLLFLFMASMLGLVWADNLILIFVFWEGTSITSYLLIAYKNEDEAAQNGARTAFIVTGLGALAMLAGLVLLGQVDGTYQISTILASQTLAQSPYFTAATILVLLGAFTKSAQFPFHFWLPGAMAAPTPASAYLHSATMVKAGIYLLARLHPALSDSPLWFWSLLIVGGITMLLGAISAFRYYDLKAILANATISQLGILVMLLAFRSEAAYIAVVVGILAHALYKGPLFLVAGIVDHAMGTRDIRRLAALRTVMPWVALTATLAGLSMAGLPPFFGFLAKETLLESFAHYAAQDGALLGQIGLALAALTGALFVGYSLTLIWEPFFRANPVAPAAHLHHAPSFAFILPPLVLTLIGTAIPFFLAQIEKLIFATPVSSIAGTPTEVHLALWHGFTPVFLTSLGAIALGGVIFWQRDRLRQSFGFIPPWLNGVKVYEFFYKGSYRLARLSTSVIQGGTLESQISTTLLTVVVMLVYAMTMADLERDLRINWALHPQPFELILGILAIVAAIVTVRAANRLSAIISIGVVGVTVTLAFVFYGAPDLALTQLLIEVLTVVLLVLVFYKIPPRQHPPHTLEANIRNLFVALAVGFFGFALVLVGAGEPFQRSISDYFSLNAVAGGHGANVVNVILVDFRGFDTMGEISVLAIAAIGGYALLRASRLRVQQRSRNYSEQARSAPSAVTHTTTEEGHA